MYIVEKQVVGNKRYPILQVKIFMLSNWLYLLALLLTYNIKQQESHCSMPVHHPTGIAVEIVGIEASNNGRSCDQHDLCGSVLDNDFVVRLRKVQILNSNGYEETATATTLYRLESSSVMWAFCSITLQHMQSLSTAFWLR